MSKDRIELKAKNSSGNQTMIMEYDGDHNEVFVTLFGNYDYVTDDHKKQPIKIQIDFDGLEPEEFNELRKLVNRVHSKMRKRNP